MEKLLIKFCHINNSYKLSRWRTWSETSLVSELMQQESPLINESGRLAMNYL